MKLHLKLIYPQDVFLCDSFSIVFLYFSSTDFFISVLSFFRLSSIISYAVSSDVILLEFINSIANPSYQVGREISTLSLSLREWHPVTAGITLFQIVLSRGSSRWWMFGVVLRKYLSLLLNLVANAK